MNMRRIKERRQYFIALAILLVFMVIPASKISAEATVNLGTSESFAVLAGSTITNTGSTTIGGSAGGNIGVHPGSSITGFPPGIVSGTIHTADATAQQAKADLLIAYNDAASRASDSDLTGQDLGGQNLKTGVYTFSTSAQLTGTLTLDAEGDPDAVFIFQIGSTLTTATDSTVSLVNGARYCRVFWQIGSSATLGTDSTFVGHIFALTSITVNNGAAIQGQLLAINGAVTLDSNTINNGVCEVTTPTQSDTDTTTSETTDTNTTDTDTTTSGTTDTNTTDTDTTTSGTTDTNTTDTDTTTSGILETAAESTQVNGDGVPSTGESGDSPAAVIIGIVLIVLATGLSILVSRRRSRE
jgi:LPXTG-motif cell wall-anchored protein